MAQITNGLSFTGSISNLSAYKMRGSDKTILRTKGGASKKKIKTSPAFEKTRRQNAEFGGRATASRWVRLALNPLLSLADYNIAGPLNALLKPYQELDQINPWGKRSIEFTKQPDLLQGFQLNKRNPFDQLIRNPVTCTLSKEHCTAQVELPSLVPGFNFTVPGKYPYLAFVVVLGVLPNLLFDEWKYMPEGSYHHGMQAFEETSWHLASKGAPAQTIQLHINETMPDQLFSLMLSVGIKFGNPGVEKVEQVRYAGAGKVLAVV